jgi:hypothetical protein
MQQLVQTGRATPDGTPTAAMQGIPQPQQGTLAGTAAPSPVNSAVGGIVAGALGGGPAVQDAMATQGQGI